MKKYLSYGAGVGSEALRLWLIEQGWDFEAVYVDHGGDWPETKEFVKTIPDLTILHPTLTRPKGTYRSLYEHCWTHRMVPSHMIRWCTVQWKIEPLHNYQTRPCIVYIGYTSDEERRVKNEKGPEIFLHYPLVCMGWTRQDCKNYIKKKTGNVPIRSGCYFCPFQKVSQWIKLKNLHPDLYEKAKALEKRNMEYRKERGKEPLTISVSKKPLEMITHEGQGRLF